MKRSSLFLFIIGFFLLNIAYPATSNAQELEKTEIITKKWGGSNYSRIVAYALSVTESYNPDMTVESYTFLFSAQNDNYEAIQDLFAIAGGSAQDVYNFTKWILRFIDTCQIEGLKVPIEDFTFPLTIEYVNWGVMGKKYYIRNGTEYHIFKKSEFEKVQKELLKYCQKHGIKIDINVDIEINPSLKNNNKG